MNTVMLLTGIALLTVAVSVGRRAWRGSFEGNPFVAPFLMVVGVGGGIALYLATGGI